MSVWHANAKVMQLDCCLLSACSPGALPEQTRWRLVGGERAAGYECRACNPKLEVELPHGSSAWLSRSAASREEAAASDANLAYASINLEGHNTTGNWATTSHMLYLALRLCRHRYAEYMIRKMDR